MDVTVNKLALTESEISEGYFSYQERQEVAMKKEPVLTKGEKIVVTIVITVNAILSVLWAIVN